MSNHKNKDIILPLSLFLLTILTRIPFTSKLLYHTDSVQFALALEKYDITVHQPHPPGYFLYVMLGRLINFFVKDANSTFIFISILFSGLAVVAIYYLGKEIFDKKTGILAALIALTSPNLWFHGEVALTYVVEAFFSAFVALLCWRMLKGEHKYIWLSVIALGIAGGIRQNTVVFLLPLWLFSIKRLPLRKIIASIGLLGIVCLLWFIPMVWMTGGWNAYNEAFREYRIFVIGHFSVFERGWVSFKMFSLSLFRHLIYGLGAGIFILGLAVYSLIRRGRLKSLERTKVLFFCLWILPSVFFYLMILYHPSSYGYVLILLPALFILTTVSIEYISTEVKKIFKKDFYYWIASVLIILNTLSFFLLKFPVSYKEIRNHDRDLSIILEGIKKFNPANTAIFIEPYISYGYRHIMYYLPAYTVYHVDFRISPSGEARKLFWGRYRETYLSDEIILSQTISEFVTLLLSMDIQLKSPNLDTIKKLTISNISNTNIYLISGNIHLIKNIYPELRISL